MQAVSQQAMGQLLQKLSADDAFRCLMQANPAKALQEVGISVSNAELPQQISLASKAAVAVEHNEFGHKLGKDVDFMFFVLTGNA